MLADGTWDVRCPPELKAMHEHRRKTSCWPNNLHFKTAEVIVQMLCKTYGIQPPKVEVGGPQLHAITLEEGRDYDFTKGCYNPETKTITLWVRSGIKTVFHEFYHHLDTSTGHKYNGNDYPGDMAFWPNVPPAYGTQFAERLWSMITGRPCPDYIFSPWTGRHPGARYVKALPGMSIEMIDAIENGDVGVKGRDGRVRKVSIAPE